MTTTSKALVVGAETSNTDLFRASTDAAGLCKSIVVETAKNIGGRKYVQVEGWQAIAVAHGCAASARSVERVQGGVRAIGEIRRMSDGAVIAEAEGFVGEDEETWYGGPNKWGKMQPKRPDYAIRAMAQTRAISRACRSAFAHVVVMMNAGLSTTPAEEVPDGGFSNEVVEADFTPVQDDKPAEPSEAYKLAVEQVKAKTTTEALGEWWNSQKATLRELMPDADYAKLIHAVKVRKDELTPPTQSNDNPFEDAA